MYGFGYGGCSRMALNYFTKCGYHEEMTVFYFHILGGRKWSVIRKEDGKGTNNWECRTLSIHSNKIFYNGIPFNFLIIFRDSCCTTGYTVVNFCAYTQL